MINVLILLMLCFLVEELASGEFARSMASSFKVGSLFALACYVVMIVLELIGVL